MEINQQYLNNLGINLQNPEALEMILDRIATESGMVSRDSVFEGSKVGEYMDSLEPQIVISVWQSVDQVLNSLDNKQIVVDFLTMQKKEFSGKYSEAIHGKLFIAPDINGFRKKQGTRNMSLAFLKLGIANLLTSKSLFVDGISKTETFLLKILLFDDPLVSSLELLESLQDADNDVYTIPDWQTARLLSSIYENQGELTFSEGESYEASVLIRLVLHNLSDIVDIKRDQLQQVMFRINNSVS